MKRITYQFALICCFLLTSFGHLPQRKLPIIDLVNHRSRPFENMLLSEVSTSIQMIPLETNDLSLLGYIYGIQFERNNLYITAGNGVFVFDSNGKFLNTLSSQGRGPQEYIALPGLFPEDNIVWLIDGTGRKMLKFSDSGKFIERFEHKYRFSEYHHSKGDAFIGFLPDLGLPGTDIMLAFFHPTGIVDSILYRNPIQQSQLYWYVPDEATFSNYQTQIKFKHLFNDTIYRIEKFGLVPDVVLNLGSRKANEKARAIAVKSDPHTHDIYEGMDAVVLRGENGRFICLEVKFGPIIYLYDKKEQKVHKWNFILPTDKRIDPEGAKKFVPMCIDKNGNLIGQTAPANEEDNPVIIIAKLKE